MNRALWVGVNNVLENLADGNFHSQFLPQFAHEALFKCLTRLAFTAGKFPHPAQMRIRVASGDQEFAIAENETGSDFDWFGFHRLSLLLIVSLILRRLD